MNQTQASRLLTLANFLKSEVCAEEFDMDVFGRAVAEESEPEVKAEGISIGCNQLLQRKTIECNTSACALGWATSVFPSQMCMRWNGDVDDLIERDRLDGTVQMKDDGVWQDVFYDDDLVQNFFGLTEAECEDLFGPDDPGEYDDDTNEYINIPPKTTPKQKAKQIEKLCASHGWVYSK